MVWLAPQPDAQSVIIWRRKNRKRLSKTRRHKNKLTARRVIRTSRTTKVNALR
nr:MAG TPA_asm: hypothetical protein [Caudoviricetes sp.]